MSIKLQDEHQEESLNLNDLLIDDQEDVLSEYLSLSIERINNEDTKVSVTTVEDNPITYSSILNGITLTDLQYLADGMDESVDE